MSNVGRDAPPTSPQPSASVAALWREFGQQVLAAHHRQALGAQCVCGSLMYHCPVIAAAQRLGLPTEDPRSSA